MVSGNCMKQSQAWYFNCYKVVLVVNPFNVFFLPEHHMDMVSDHFRWHHLPLKAHLISNEHTRHGESFRHRNSSTQA